VETKAGIDGTIYGLNSAHQLFTYTAKAGWVLVPSALQSAGGNPLMHISVGSSSEVLALNTSPGGSNVYILNSAKTAATTPPDNSFNGENVFWPPPYGGETYVAWLSDAPCFSWTGHQPWACIYGWVNQLSVNMATVPYACTHNP